MHHHSTNGSQLVDAHIDHTAIGSGFDTRASLAPPTGPTYYADRYFAQHSIMSSSHQRSPAGLGGGAENEDAARPTVATEEKVKEEDEKRELRLLKRNVHKTVTQCGVDPSQSFEGSYDRLGIELGNGTFGTVDLAKCKRTDRFVAAKIVNLGRGKFTIPFTEHAVREIQILQRVRGHPNVSAYCDSFLGSAGLKPSLLIVTEFAPGGSLGQYVRTMGRLDERQMKRVIHQLLSALAHCHCRGVVSPSCILFIIIVCLLFLPCFCSNNIILPAFALTLHLLLIDPS